MFTKQTNTKMLHIVGGLLLALLTLFLVGTAQAQTETITWQATYWNNVSLSGNAVFTRTETEIDHRWGNGSPAAPVLSDRFSARWSSTPNLQAGRYRFTVTVDDGARLYVDGRLIIDAWEIQAETTYQEEIYLAGGNVPIVLEYFENTGLATIELSWTPLAQFTQRWQGEYFNNVNLSGDPALVRDDAAIDFDWGDGSPAPDIIAPETFSARWTRTVDLPPGQYRFTMTTDDGGRVWLGDDILIDAWLTQPATTYEREIALGGGPVALRMEYFENGGQAEAHLSWTRVHDLPTPQPGETVDDRSAGFVRGGPPAGWNQEPEGYNNTLTWTQNSEESIADSYNWARWFPDLEPGIYEVSAYIPERFSTTSAARYWISHSNGYDLREVNQVTNSGSWVTLGTFQFDGTGSDFVSLADVTFETAESRLVAYDAMRWTSVTAPGGDGISTMTVTPQQATAGTAVTVNGSGFPPGQPIELGMGPPNTEPFGTYGEGVVQPDGTITLTFTMPVTWPDGEPIIDSLPPDNELVLILITDDGTKATESITYVP